MQRDTGKTVVDRMCRSRMNRRGPSLLNSSREARQEDCGLRLSDVRRERNTGQKRAGRIGVGSGGHLYHAHHRPRNVWDTALKGPGVCRTWVSEDPRQNTHPAKSSDTEACLHYFWRRFSCIEGVLSSGQARVRALQGRNRRRPVSSPDRQGGVLKVLLASSQGSIRRTCPATGRQHRANLEQNRCVLAGSATRTLGPSAVARRAYVLRITCFGFSSTRK